MKKHKFITLITLLFSAWYLSGCVSATSVAHNEDLSIDFNPSDYGIVYFLPPEEDPRNVVPRVEAELKSMGYRLQTMDREKPLEGTQGSGFWISNEYLLTCAHVIGEETTATIWLDSERLEADLVASDEDKDLALLKVRNGPRDDIAPLQLDTSEPSMGDDVFTIGYPMTSILGNQARLTKGLVSAAQGFKGAEEQFQITAAIQPGNSGGPVFDENGYLRGVVTETLNTLEILRASGGAAPQNVNFALKPTQIEKFLIENLPEYEAKIDYETRSVASVKEVVVKVQSGILPEYLEGKAKLIVLFDYHGFWDGWYRFGAFLISAFDFDSGERIFTAGQLGDNLISNEEVVIKDTLNEVRMALGKALEKN